MTWTTFHRRGEVLRHVTQALDSRLDGRLPLDVPGVDETFGDELALLGALQLRWHTRLSGHLERALAHASLDLDTAVVEAWHATADELPGTRLVLDHYRAEPTDDAMAWALATAEAKEHVLLAAMAGRTGASTPATVAAGLELEERARDSYLPAARDTADHRGRGWFGRLRARVAA